MLALKVRCPLPLFYSSPLTVRAGRRDASHLKRWRGDVMCTVQRMWPSPLLQVSLRATAREWGQNNNNKTEEGQ